MGSRPFILYKGTKVIKEILNALKEPQQLIKSMQY